MSNHGKKKYRKISFRTFKHEKSALKKEQMEKLVICIKSFLFNQHWLLAQGVNRDFSSIEYADIFSDMLGANIQNIDIKMAMAEIGVLNKYYNDDESILFYAINPKTTKRIVKEARRLEFIRRERRKMNEDA